MSIPCIDDQRGLIFTISRETNPVYQVTSGAWAKPENLWQQGEIPQEIRDKVADLIDGGKPGAFVRFLQGEDGVYVICEKNIKTLPETASDDLAIETPRPSETGRALSSYDIVICAKGGTVAAEGGGTTETREGDYYVIGCGDWSQVVLEEQDRPKFVETTKEMLHLLEELNGQNFLSMKPDPDELLPVGLEPPTSATVGINCYVLNLARFQR
jgi:hypothetical protein